ncbi:hypothetical protein BVER_05649 [Candidatus Burkholderia verschuerenii]|uniref:KfrB domain-containing protein n=1 Tax=Candidatus Burkholderia verschuerenii TaxID=242163 RepID=A0A0L0MF57_9BURK|nr:hypothetical protein [Candidatus Burkholderia verschuerenii]KND60574.1 hypothetical protein BVER_05649 [Candidatus Burkholderia verschuerenii]
MATAREIEDMTVAARTHQVHGRIPDGEWQRFTQAAEGAFDGQLRARGNDRLLDHDQLAAMGLARQMAVADRSRENPFEHEQLRRAFNSERTYEATREATYGNVVQAGIDGLALPAEIRHERALLEAYRDGLAERENNLQTQQRGEPDQAGNNAELSIEARQLANPGAGDPVMQMGMKIPAGRQAQARDVAEQLAHSEDVHGKPQIERAEPGRSYEGRVVDVTENRVFQNVGDRVIEHDRQALTGRGMSGELAGREVKIDYPHGRVGLVKEAGQAREMGQQEKALQKDYGGRER